MACGGDGGVSKDCVEQVVLNKGAADVHSCRPVLVFPTFYNNRNSQFLKIYFIEVWLIYNVVLISAVQQSDSAICIPISPPSLTSLSPPPPSRSSQSTEDRKSTRLNSSH